ncbi:ABC transporter permease [Frankia sp. AgB1.9]|uniref:ABC transporter permease n=1 Tax=unclassified Frankia TaxID=2632575 RepID=UPI0019342F86|nr:MULTISPECIES: ABC transporter permease [unclassified Frankia]MBL7489196.1 ABC transporter permease [Frankia sp. AgW1.1]MBL7554152.1 ABC transporter permease [Frankia sp. AgB1.9]MBL7618521.1 ABC transporter permease [Frankia sp. AgB1.8]
MQITIVLLLGILLLVALVAPRTRTRSLVPVVCILLGWYWSFNGFVPTLAAVGAQVSAFLHTLPIRF